MHRLNSPKDESTALAGDNENLGRDYVNMRSRNTGYPETPEGQDTPLPMTPLTVSRSNRPQSPPDGYDYPPVPVPVHPLEKSPITAQPITAKYGTTPTTSTNAQSGLQAMVSLSKLIIKQSVEQNLDTSTHQIRNVYKIKDSNGTDLYTADETTNCCSSNFCDRCRSFDVYLKDMNGQDVIRFFRPCSGGSCWLPCCLQRIEIYAPPDELVGTVEQQWSPCAPKFLVKDADGCVKRKIVGPWSNCGNGNFIILSRDGIKPAGKISKKWPAVEQEAFQDVSGISFPANLDVKMKAVLLGACFLIDFMYFE